MANNIGNKAMEGEFRSIRLHMGKNGILGPNKSRLTQIGADNKFA